MKKIFIIFTVVYLMILSVAVVNGQQKVVPIFDMKSGGLLGGVQGDKFVNAKTASKSVKTGDKLSRFGLIGKEDRETTINDFRYLEVCNAYHLGIEPRSDSGIAVGKEADWNLVPRVPTQIDLNNKTYKKIVADFLKTKQFKKPDVKISQAVSIDLDGDGKNEVILTATNYRENLNEGTASGYSLVLLRKYVQKSIRYILLAEEFYPETLKNKTANVEVTSFEVSAIADLNGDGKMEIVINSVATYYDGGGSRVVQINGTKAVTVKMLSTGCGFF